MATEQEVSELKRRTHKKLMKKANVIGMGVGFKETSGVKTDELSLTLLVRDKQPVSALSAKDRVPAVMDDIKTDVIRVGRVVAHQSRRDRHRPATGGVSIGHFAITEGTLGLVVRDNNTSEQFILSNNHVLANSNDARAGDGILQPGPGDGGKMPADKIAELVRFIPLKYKGTNQGGGSSSDCPLAQFLSSMANVFTAMSGSKTRFTAIQADPVNLVDAAVARPDEASLVSEEIKGIGTVNGTAQATVGMPVKKSGRTTGVTESDIRLIDTSITVGYGSQEAYFDHQLMTRAMSNPGDSGAVLVDNNNRVVGLLFSGSDEVTFFNPIDSVLTALNISI